MIILYPTDTLYGLGVDATDADAVARLQELKGRNEGKPISIAVDSFEMLAQYAEVTPLAKTLADAFLPGKLTLVLTAKPGLAPGVVSNDGSVGIRIPNRNEVLELIHELDTPITATSANVSGMLTENIVEKILAQFGNKSSMITRVIDAGELPPSEASTVVDARGSEPKIIREAAISKVAIEEALG